jgi:hypothetical protein
MEINRIRPKFPDDILVHLTPRQYINSDNILSIEPVKGGTLFSIMERVPSVNHPDKFAFAFNTFEIPQAYKNMENKIRSCLVKR